MSWKQIGDPLYIFLDEAGNFDFSLNGTKYFILTALSSFRPFGWEEDINELQYTILEQYQMEIEEFHASEDDQVVRDLVFEALVKHRAKFRVDSVIMQKNKAFPSVREPERFYPMILKCLLEYVIKGHKQNKIFEAIFVTDKLALNRKRQAITKGIKTNLSAAFEGKLKYRIYHWDSKSSFGLQAVDYVSWAIYRKWTNKDLRSYDLVKSAVYSEFDYFKPGLREFY